jgi:dihydropteroate synthase
VKLDNFSIMVRTQEFVLPLPHGKIFAPGAPIPVMGALAVPARPLSGPAIASIVAQGQSLLADGASVLNIGVDLNGPDAASVALDDELSSVVSIVAALSAAVSAPISVETASARVAAAAIEQGASIINDVWGLQRDREMARVAAATDAALILSHNRIAIEPDLDIVADIIAFLSRSIELALAAGVTQSRMVVDPGIGLAKTASQDIACFRRLDQLNILGCPILLDAPSARTLDAVAGAMTPAEREAAALAATVVGVMKGAALLRVHDVAAYVQALQVLHVILPKSRSARDSL